jgi:hypothetical protein
MDKHKQACPFAFDTDPLPLLQQAGKSVDYAAMMALNFPLAEKI